jgi:F-box protein 11
LSPSDPDPERPQMMNLISITVDKGNPMCYQTIQSAIDDSCPNGHIIVCEGIYKENLVITQPGLKIECQELDPEVYLIGNRGPAVLIDILGSGNSDRCLIQNIKFIHKGGCSLKKNNTGFVGANPIKELGVNLRRLTKIKHLLLTLDLYYRVFNSVPFNTGADAVIYVKSGGVSLKNCLLSLSFMLRTTQEITPVIMMDEGTNNLITNCEMKGNPIFQTTGIVIKNSNCVIKGCSIEGFLQGGIIMCVTEDTEVKVTNTLVKGCKHAGIQILGVSPTPTVEYCRIEENMAAGIQVCSGNSGEILKNNIVQNNDGIEIISSDPTILKNKIINNYYNGVITRALDSLICQPKIYLNEISSNRLNGVICLGPNNVTRIYDNWVVAYNRMAGIKADSGASIVIRKNTIYKNIQQGILISSTASGFMATNTIYENIKANVALGGNESVNNVLVENKIYGGRCEGIFIIGNSFFLQIMERERWHADSKECHPG